MRATFDNSKNWLVPGDYMKVKLIAPRKISYMTVPQSCTKGDAMSGYYVWTIKNDKKDKKGLKVVERKDIKVSDVINNNWIVDSGLNKNDSVVVSGIQNIAAEGQKVKIIDAETYAKKEAAGKE